MIARRALSAFAVAAISLLAIACGGDAQRETVEIRFSSFGPAVIEARAGEPLTIALRNGDPIEHEWLVGDAAMHERHRAGTEAHHDTIPTEVTIPAMETRVTTVTFDEPGLVADAGLLVVA
ncbi:MAG: hypothetical protein WD359_08355, partial [Dehalococcoidia bacterium]